MLFIGKPMWRSIMISNITIPNTGLISILLRLHAVSSRLLLNLWHSNSPEPKIHFFLLESMSHLSPVSCPWWSKGVYRCQFRCLQMSMLNVDRVPCKCRWKCRKYITKNVKKCPKMTKNVNFKHPEMMPKWQKCKCQAPEDVAEDKKCQCQLKRPANVEHMSMSTVPPNVDPIWSTSVHTLMMITHFLNTQYSSSSNVCTKFCLMSL